MVNMDAVVGDDVWHQSWLNGSIVVAYNAIVPSICWKFLLIKELQGDGCLKKKKWDISTSSVFEMLVLRWISKTWKGGISNILICEIGVATLIEEVWKRITIIEGLVISNEESAR